MLPFNSARPSGPAVGGPFNHLDIPQRDVDSVNAKLTRFRGLIVSLRQEADKGSDDALKAGYDHLDPNRIDRLVRECQHVKSLSRKLDKEVRLKQQVMKELESPENLTIIHGTPDDEDSRRRAAFRVLKLLANSPTNFHVFLRGLGIEVTPEIKAALNMSLAQASDSQTDRWLQGAHRNEETLALQTKFDEQSVQLANAIRDAQVQRELVEQLVKERDDAEQKAADDISKSASECARAKSDMRKANEQSVRLQDELQDANARQLKLQQKIDLLKAEAEIETVTSNRKVCEIRLETAKLKKANSDLVVAKGALEVDLDELQEQHDTEVERLKGERKAAEKSAAEYKKQLGVAQSSLQMMGTNLQKAQGKLTAANSDLRKTQVSLATCRKEADRAKETTLEQQKVLQNKDQQILDMAVTSDRQNTLLTSRAGVIETQVQQASNFLRHLSINVKSEVWQKVAENVLVDSTRTQATRAQWYPWTICSSWAADVVLEIRQDDRSLDAMALDVLAILDVKSTDVKDLLSRLQAFQGAMRKSSSMVPTITQLLLGALTNAVGDSRLHLMHRVAMCQVGHLLAPTAEALVPLEQAMDGVDLRVNRLVSALKAFDLSGQLQLEDSIAYEDIALVGFGRDPHGILAVSLVGRELCWVDQSCIRREYNLIELVPITGDPIRLSIENMERLSWILAHS
ncbi:hypothetical protein ACHAPJ_012948 [Fusarium lateritium]